MPEPFAVLFSYDPATGEHTADPLVGLRPNGDDPITWAFCLRDSIEADFPGRVWAIASNDAAVELRSAALVDAVLGRRHG